MQGKAMRQVNTDIAIEIQVDVVVEEDKQNLPKVPEHACAAHEVREYATCFRWGNDLLELVGHTTF